MLGLLLIVIGAIAPLNEGWQYALTPPGAPVPAAESAWSENIVPRADRDRWYRVRLPASTPRDPHLVFRSYLPAFELSVEQVVAEGSGSTWARVRRPRWLGFPFLFFFFDLVLGYCNV